MTDTKASLGGSAASSVKHTPGPWRLEPGPFVFEFVVVAVNGIPVADTRDIPGGRANAKLIAAAPAMADMLYEQWELERCEDETCVDHGPLISVLRAAGMIVEDGPKAPEKIP